MTVAEELFEPPLDGKEDIVLNLDRDDLYQLMLVAHEQDITLNQLVENILREYIEAHKNEQTD
jgi:predicted HicB family RNase H-like nuclease